jgi:hypothetical protein
MKIHLQMSSEPIKHGEDVVVACGSTCVQAVFAFAWDEQSMGPGAKIEWNPLRMCKRCIDNLNRRVLHGYLYGIVSGEEAKQAEAERLAL